MSLGANVELLGGNTELKGTPGILVADPLGLSHHAPGDSKALGSAGSLLLPDSCTSGDQRKY